MPNTNLKTVYAMINGQKVVATYDASSDRWTVEATAPAESSWNQPNHVYLVSLHAEDLAGNAAEMTSSDPTYGDQLKIRVLEKTKPVAQITKPTESSVLGSATVEVNLEIKDEGGSGLNMSTVEFKVNGVNKASELSWNDGEDGKKTATYSATGLSDGANSVSLAVTDNDGNISDTHTVNFIIATAGPTLEITTPADNIITNAKTVDVVGIAKAGSEFTTITKVTVNGETVSTDGSGNFTKTVTLTEGSNTITIIATDSLDRETRVTRTVIMDTEAPVISDVVTEAVTVDASGKIKITFKVTDNLDTASIANLSGNPNMRILRKI